MPEIHIKMELMLKELNIEKDFTKIRGIDKTLSDRIVSQ